MPFPRTFKHLLEPDPASIARPDYVRLAYGACATRADSCGWSGWMLEAAFRRTATQSPSSTGDEILPSPHHDACPRCGQPLFRTGIALRCEPSSDQEPPMGRAGQDYDVADIEYE